MDWRQLAINLADACMWGSKESRAKACADIEEAKAQEAMDDLGVLKTEEGECLQSDPEA